MLASLVIVFREVIEAGLIVGIVLAATRGVPRRGRWVGSGVAAGALGACVVAAFAGELGALFNGSGQELFNAVDPAGRRRHADLAQRLDGKPWPGACARGARRRHVLWRRAIDR